MIVTREMIQQEYARLLSNIGIGKGFGYGWFRNFLAPKRLVIRRISGSGRRIPEKYRKSSHTRLR
jgi:hypothetical protein